VLNIYKSSIQLGLCSLYLFTDNPSEIIASYPVDNHPIISPCTFVLTMAGCPDKILPAVLESNIINNKNSWRYQGGKKY
jgi:hypothetical protein